VLLSLTCAWHCTFPTARLLLLLLLLSQGFVHRDLKPDNILMQQLPNGIIIIRIADFGLTVSKVCS
jgi:serine/threonine protein kinase